MGEDLISTDNAGVRDRLSAVAREWRVEVGDTVETESSLIAFGQRDADQVVLKVVKRPGDEWRSGEVVSAFGGRGMVRLLEYEPGASLLERLVPGDELVELTRCERDDDATVVLADVIGAMTPGVAPAWCPTLTDWTSAFGWYFGLGDARIPLGMVHRAAGMYTELCETQGPTRLLHGDLQHYNVLDGGKRGWVSIDPKGVVGEVEYEIGAALRNPTERPDMFTRSAVERRIAVLSSRLGLDADRVLRWAYAQAVLSEIWRIQDGYPIGPDDGAMLLASAVEPML